MNRTGHISSSFEGEVVHEAFSTLDEHSQLPGEDRDPGERPGERLSEDCMENIIMCLWPLPHGSRDLEEPLKRTAVVRSLGGRSEEAPELSESSRSIDPRVENVSTRT